MKFTDEEDGWHLTLYQGSVQLLQVDYRLGIFLYDSTDIAKLFVGTECVLISSGHRVLIEPENSPTLAPILRYKDAEVRGLKIRRTGQLRLQFESGDSLEVEPDCRYEAWELSSSIGFRVICSPGGAVSLFFQDRTKIKSHVVE